MPSSKEKQNSIAGRALVQGQKEPSARAAKRAAAKSTQSGQTGRPGRAAPQDPSAYAASVWGAQNNFEVTVPSGQTCLCRELTIERLIEMGLLQAINSLEGIVANKVLPQAQGQKPVEVDMASLMANADNLTKVIELVNTIVCEAVVAPRLEPVPEAGDRVVGLIYVDSVPLADRFAIFSEVTGGLEGLATFR